MNMLLGVVVVSCFGGAFAGKLPPYITACSASDPNLNQCAKSVIERAVPLFALGIPELGIAPLDPVALGKVVVPNPALKLTFTDTIVTGLKNSKINGYKISPKKGKGILDFTANVTLKAHYDMDGQVLILPIRGNGQAKIKITNLNIVIKYDYSTKNGHWDVTSYQDSYKMDRAVFKLQNLFNGNKELAETTHKFLNENSQTIIKEIGTPAIKHIIVKCVEVVNEFFHAVPEEELLRP